MNGSVLPTASGYEAYNNLIYPMYATDFITRFYPRTIAGLISSRDIVPAEIKEMGDHVIFRRTPRGETWNYKRNGVLNVGRLNTVTSRIDINRGRYYNIKLDKVDQTQIQNIQEWIDGYIYDAQQQVARHVDVEMFDAIAAGAHAANKGKCAGASTGGYNLGTYGAPVVINASNALSIINACGTMLSEANVDFTGRFMALPTPYLSLLSNNQVLSQAYASGMDRSIQLIGAQAYNGPIGGFEDIYFSNVMPRRWDDKANAWCYAIPFGMKDATAFIAQISENEIIDQDKESFAKYWRGLFVYGYGVLRPEAVGVLYCTLDMNG